MAGIFLSYRRGPGASEAAGRLYDRLAARFGKENVFMDVDTVRPGMDFVEAIGREIGSSRAVLAIIDPNWATDATGRNRISEEGDYVRLEIATALRRDVTVIPVLVLGAQMPTADEVPADVRPLTRRQAVVLTHERFNTDVLRLERELKGLVGAQHEPSEPAPTRPSTSKPAATKPVIQPSRPARKRRGRWVALLLIVAVAAAAAAVSLVRPWEDGPGPEPTGGNLVWEGWERPEEAVVLVWGRNEGDEPAQGTVVCEFEGPDGERWEEAVGPVSAEPHSPFEAHVPVPPDVGVAGCWLG